MAGFRSYFPAGCLVAGKTVRLDPAESRHLTKALRARPGDAVTLFDGRGSAWSAELVQDGREATVRVQSELVVSRPPTNICLAMAMLKGKAMDAVIKAAVEIGATQLVPLATERTEVKLDASRAASKVEHWQAVAIEAMKQSGNLCGLDILPPQSLKSWLQSGPADECKLVASLAGQPKPLMKRLPVGNPGVVMLIGPEGDFSPAEYENIFAAGYLPVRLAKHVLRAETAAIYALSVLQAACMIR